MMRLRPKQGAKGKSSFSLIEVVIALGICSFAIVALVGLFSSGIQSGQESQQKIQAADLASLILSTRAATPTNNLPFLAIPPTALATNYSVVYGTNTPAYVGYDGQVTNRADAVYQVVCSAGTNAATGANLAEVYLMLAWPPQGSLSETADKRYEVVTYIPIH